MHRGADEAYPAERPLAVRLGPGDPTSVEAPRAAGRCRGMREPLAALIIGLVLVTSCCLLTQKRSSPAPAPLLRPVNEAGAPSAPPDAAEPEPEAAAPLDAPEPDAATPPDAAAAAPRPRYPATPCDRMRDAADWSAGERLYVDHLPERPVEEAVRRFYERQVLAAGIDERSFARHPVIFQHLETATGALVGECVAHWRATEPEHSVPGGLTRLSPTHRYLELTFEFNDASDGENAYTAFVDLDTRQVAAMFHYNNFTP